MKSFYTYAEVIGRDVAECVASEKTGDFLSSGAYFGAIARIAVWGSPEE
jgi:hypothetical protein